jgi:hypothetical protein
MTILKYMEENKGVFEMGRSSMDEKPSSKQGVKLEVGMQVVDNDPRQKSRVGEIAAILPSAKKVQIRWKTTGKATLVKLDRVGVLTHNGYRVVPSVSSLPDPAIKESK